MGIIGYVSYKKQFVNKVQRPSKRRDKLPTSGDVIPEDILESSTR